MNKYITVYYEISDFERRTIGIEFHATKST